MAELVVVAFDTENDADRVLNELNKLRREYLIDLSDAVVAIREPQGKVHIKQSVSMVGHGASYGALSGALWGTLVGLLFMNPIAGFAVGSLVGAGTGALSGSLVDFGIDDDLIREMGQTLQPGTSALFLLVRKAQPEKVLAELKGFGGRVMRSSLSPDQEARLQAALRQVGSTEPTPQTA
ncbi:DUF1269 domain-containing protein [Sphingomonas lenta]|uniref:DUF1269 domain-containing protein n=1 Tax=Sphingomonas lenta TaxID=1141887 RepID=A0A2A2SHV6_9SPHN|nr:DUF1269 domain-containing protein [Sphingomonas lenta]PAX08857.1 hypothetical protein CKY28_05750 [Sphingomonas lenta]